MFIILTIPSPINLFKNLPDSGRHVTSPYQGLFPADRRERRKELGYEVEDDVEPLASAEEIAEYTRLHATGS